MGIEVKQLVLGIVQTVCYIIGDTETEQAIVIDPADDAPAILRAAGGWTIQQILATHSHFDHVLAAQALQEHTGAPFRLHRDALPLLEGMALQGRRFGLELPPAPATSDFIEAGEIITVGSIRLEAALTPGHAPGHVSFILHEERVVFSGDCLFAGSIGRTDLPGADQAQLLRSIREVLLPLGDDFKVAPGHPPPTSIGQERRTNPFLMGI